MERAPIFQFVNVTRSRFAAATFSLVCGLSLVMTTTVSAGFARKWTDQQGKQTVAEFVKYEDGMVVLVKDRNTLKVPYLLLSQADQEYIRKQLEAKGQADQLPPPGTPAPEYPKPQPVVNSGNVPPNGIPGANPVGGNPTFPPSPVIPMPPGGAVPGAPGITITPPGAIPAPPPPVIVDANSGYIPPAPQIPAPAVPPIGTPPVPVIGATPAPPVPPITDTNPGYTGPNVSIPTMVFEKQCSSCRRTVPQTSKAGDRCPHCGTYWGHEQNAGGGRTYASGYRAGRITGLGTLIALIVGGIGWVVKKVS